MYVFRQWKRIHKPFIFLVLCGVSTIVVGLNSANSDGNVPKIEGEFRTVVGSTHDVRHGQPAIMTDQVTTSGSTVGANGNEGVEKLTDAELLFGEGADVLTSTNNQMENAVPQLPFCGKAKSTPDAESTPSPSPTGTTTGDLGNEHSNEEQHNTTPHIISPSEELVPLRGLDLISKSGRHVLIATLDGQVSLLGQGGEVVWSIGTGQLFSSTISSLQLSENGKWINLIPSLSGGLYKYDGEHLQPMPLTADSLLRRSFKLSNDVVITGGKEVRTFGIDVSSGAVRYECGIDDCVYPSKAAFDSNEEKQAVLVIKKQLQTVRAIDSVTGAERWNFSVGTHELALAGVNDGCHDENESKSNGVLQTSDNVFLNMIVPEGIVIGGDRINGGSWQQKFASPISQAWILENGRLVSVDPIKMSHGVADNSPALYIGIHKQQFYVQETEYTAERIENLLGVNGSIEVSGRKKEQLKLEWKPSGGQENTALTPVSTHRPQTWSPSSSFQPFFVFDGEEVIATTPSPLAIEGTSPLETGDATDSEHESEDEDEDPIQREGFTFEEEAIQVVIMSLWYWWKEVLGISLLTAILVNILLMRPMIRVVRGNTIAEMLGYFRQFYNRQKEEQMALIPRTSNESGYTTTQTTTTGDTVIESTLKLRHRTTSSSSNTSQIDENIPFSSQYLREFEPIQCLGRGGFGVVFEAKKKIDDRNYAVKRIPLPNNEKSRSRVMREVKSLAQLDHKNIVRYFNAWTESPPTGWLEKSDPLWGARCLGSPCATTDYPYPSEVFSPSMQSMSKPDHSKISVPDTPCEEDSFIVFTNDNQLPSSVNDPKESETVPLVNNVNISISSSCNSSHKGMFVRPTSLNIRSLSSTNENWGEQSLARNSNSKSTEKNEQEEDDVNDHLDQQVMYLYIQQELCQKRTLQHWLRTEKHRSLVVVVKIFSQIVDAVEYVHSKKLIHRDLKPSNIFLAGDTGDDGLTVKIGDFGLATTASTELQESDVRQTPDNESSGDTVRINLTNHVGTHLYMSPEQYQRQQYDFKVDIYSLGLIFFELLVPFSTEMERHDVLSRVRKLIFPEDFAVSYPYELKLIEEMVSHDPTKRPDATRIKVWVKDHLLMIPLTASCPSRLGSLKDFEGVVPSHGDFVPTLDRNDLIDRAKFRHKTQSCM